MTEEAEVELLLQHKNDKENETNGISDHCCGKYSENS